MTAAAATAAIATTTKPFSHGSIPLFVSVAFHQNKAGVVSDILTSQ